MKLVDPDTLFAGTVLLLVPHMDDEVLACGGTLARVRDKRGVHVVYATDGAGSPVPPASWMGGPDPELPRLRMEEALAALALLGVPGQNVDFLGFPDGRLAAHAEELEQAIRRRLAELDPASVVVPFRYDRHPDHVALNQAATACFLQGRNGRELYEYFVYYRWRMLPGGDVRPYLRPDQLVGVAIGEQAALKRRALDCFATQTTRYFPWQHRPNLTPAMLDRDSRGPEMFLRYSEALPGHRVFRAGSGWLR